MKRLLLAAAALLACVPAFAQPGSGTIEYTPDTCIIGDEMPLFRVTTFDQGTLRAFFRRVGTTDWCQVDGENHGPNSTVTLPKFTTGDEIEYYFIVLDKDGRQVLAKSPQIYRAKSAVHCDTPYARHAMLVTLECLPPSQNPLASSMAAGYAAKVQNPRKRSQEGPED